MTDKVAEVWRPPGDANRTPMNGVSEPAASPVSAADPGVSGVFADIRRLYEDGKTLVAAEIAYQTTRASVAAAAAKSIAIYAAVAAVLGLFAMVAVTVGLLLALTPLVTAWGATAIVTGVYVIVAFICLKRASRRWRQAKALLTGSDTAP